LNNVIYTRGNKKDFNAWSAAGNPGWSYDEILPYYKKIETANIRDFQNNGFHGFDGPVSVEDVPFRSQISHTMIKAANLSGYPYVDYNSDFQMGVSYMQQHSKNGWRITSGKAYLEPIAMQRKNLHILTNAKVTKVLINASNVQYDSEPIIK
jgi:choline dehydrogenase-like flavoprotein